MTDTPFPRNSDVLTSVTELAEDILAALHDELLLNYRFMNRPFAHLPHKARMNIRTCATDAHSVQFAPGYVLNSYAHNSEELARAYLHMTLHCLLGHPFVPPNVDMLRWSCACDAAVTVLLQQLDKPLIHVENAERDAALAEIVEAVGSPTAQQIYAYLEHTPLTNDELTRLYLLFGMDTHDVWIQHDNEFPQTGTQADTDTSDSLPQQLQDQWLKIARQTEMDKQRTEAGSDSPAAHMTLSDVDVRPLGLDELLATFSAPRETMRVNPDEFDYIYYTFGLDHYGNIPLIEPLEYTEDKLISDFFVVLDTSGSIDERLMRFFVSRACGALLQTNALQAQNPTSQIRLIQCDMRIQDEQILASVEDVYRYLDTLQIKGRGGTDFRPVFDHVEILLDKGEVADVAGLIYFTDGAGTFPQHAPSYDVAFVFVDKSAPVPPWATAALTYSDELESED